MRKELFAIVGGLLLSGSALAAESNYESILDAYLARKGKQGPTEVQKKYSATPGKVASPIERKIETYNKREILNLLPNNRFGSHLPRIMRHYGQNEVLKAIQKVHSVANKDYQTVIRTLSTPLEATVYCLGFLEFKTDEKLHGKENYFAPFRVTHKLKKGDCDDFAIAAAAILSDDGYDCTSIMIDRGKRNEKSVDLHMVFIYQDPITKKYGTIGSHGHDITYNENSPEHTVDAISRNSRRKFFLAGNDHITDYLIDFI